MPEGWLGGWPGVEDWVGGEDLLGEGLAGFEDLLDEGAAGGEDEEGELDGGDVGGLLDLDCCCDWHAARAVSAVQITNNWLIRFIVFSIGPGNCRLMKLKFN